MMGQALAAHVGATPDNPLNLYGLASEKNGIPRILITHDEDPHHKAPHQLRRSKAKYREKRVILLVRDPRDVLVSLYFELSKRAAADRYTGSLEEFLREPIGSTDTLVAFYNIWAGALREIPATLLVRYEDMHTDPQRELRRVMDFIGVEAISDEVLSDAAASTTFQKMRAMEKAGELRSKRLRPTNVDDPESYKTRRGRVGGFREYLSPEQVDELDRRLAQLDDVYGYALRKADADRET